MSWQFSTPTVAAPDLHRARTKLSRSRSASDGSFIASGSSHALPIRLSSEGLKAAIEATAPTEAFRGILKQE